MSHGNWNRRASVAMLVALWATCAAAYGQTDGANLYEPGHYDAQSEIQRLQQRLDAYDRELRDMRSAVRQTIQRLPATQSTYPAEYRTSPSSTRGYWAPQDENVFGRLKEVETQLEQMHVAAKKRKDAAALKPSIKIRGRIQADIAAFSQSTANRATVGDMEDGADFRRVRIGAQGQAFDITEYLFEIDFAGGNVTFTDVYMQVTDLPFLGTVRVGHYYEPNSLEQLTSDNYIAFLERGLPNAFATGRNWGLSAWNYNEQQSATWAYGVFRTGSDGAGEDVGDEGEKSFTTRVTWLPYYDEPSEGRCLFHVGGSFSYRDADEGSVQFRQRPEVRMRAAGEGDVPRFVDTGIIAADAYELYGAEVAWVNGPLSIQSEYMLTNVHQTGGPDVAFHGAYVFLSYFLTGESRPYKRTLGAFNRVSPQENFFRVRTADGGMGQGSGAWEVAARWSYLDMNDGNIAGGRVQDVTLGLNWYLTPYMRVALNYIYVDLDDPVFANSSANIYSMRFQFFW